MRAPAVSRSDADSRSCAAAQPRVETNETRGRRVVRRVVDLVPRPPGEKDFGDDALGWRAVAENAHRETVNEAAVLVVGLGERVRVTDRGPRQGCRIMGRKIRPLSPLVNPTFREVAAGTLL